MGRQDKVTMSCTSVELASTFRSLADALERGRIRLGTLDVDWKEVSKVALSIRNRAGEANVKLKVESGSQKRVSAGPESQKSTLSAAPKSRPRVGYGALKKRMKKIFKNIMYSLHDHAWPDVQDVEAFVRDSAYMIQFPGKGEEFYREYSQAVGALRAAIAAEDMEGATRIAHQLNDLKTRCHKHSA